MTGLFLDDLDNQEVPKEQESKIILEFTPTCNLGVDIRKHIFDVTLKEKEILKMTEVNSGKRKRPRS